MVTIEILQFGRLFQLFNKLFIITKMFTKICKDTSFWNNWLRFFLDSNTYFPNTLLRFGTSSSRLMAMILLWRSLLWYLLGTGGTSSGSSFKTSFLFKRASPTALNADIKLLPSHFHAICFIIYWEVILILSVSYLGTWFCSLLKWITKFPSVKRSLLYTMVALIVWHLQAYK